MRGSNCMFALAAASMAAVVFAISVLIGGPVPAALAQATPSLAIDVDPVGNSATALATREVCVEADTGDRFEVDVTVENVGELSAWEMYLGYDNTVVTVVDRDVQLFTASSPSANAFDISASVPHDSDTPFRIGAANIADPPEGVSGSGVLARLTLEAVGAGTTELDVGIQQSDIGKPVGPTLTDVNGNQISDNDGDSFFDGPILSGTVTVDRSCTDSAGDGPITVLSGGGGGISWWIFLAAAVGLVATAGIGGIALITFRRTAGSS
jgi:hypothetical protein